MNWPRICISGVQFIDSGNGGVVIQNGSESSLVIEAKVSMVMLIGLVVLLDT